MTPELLQRFYHPMFAERKSLGEALEYAYSMDDPAVTTAVHVVLNTVIKRLAAAPESDTAAAPDMV